MAKEKLIPPDLERCQVERREGSFMSFGIPKMIRCENRPKWIAKDKKAPHGEMSICEECKPKLLEFGPPVTLRAIPEKVDLDRTLLFALAALGDQESVLELGHFGEKTRKDAIALLKKARNKKETS